MQMIICAVFDGAVQTYGRPFFVHHRGQAVRSFTDEIRATDSSSDINKHPEDFTLHAIGVFDDQSGHIEPAAPELLVRGKDLMKA